MLIVIGVLLVLIGMVLIWFLLSISYHLFSENPILIFYSDMASG